jgi:hypothetical protein
MIPRSLETVKRVFWTVKRFFRVATGIPGSGKKTPVSGGSADGFSALVPQQ